MNSESIFSRRCRRLFFLASLMLAGGAVLVSCTSDDDLDETTPSDWGESIYSWLKGQGNYTNTVRLIEDLGYKDVLDRTGSKTLFVADDDAYARFFQSNSWGVGSYEALSTAQKKLMLRGSMIDNSMQITDLATAEGDMKGECLRRKASTDAYDSVMVITPDQMPRNPYWQRHIDAGKNMVLMLDKTKAPLLHFTEKQMTNKLITNDDYDFLFNYTTKRTSGDASVNGVQVEQGNIKCLNGFVHKMAEVVTQLPNMAEIIASNPDMSIYNSLIERFCAPYPLTVEETQQYNNLYGTQVDTVYQKRFFSQKSIGGVANTSTPDGGAVNGTLSFDPEWNAYYSGLAEPSEEVAMQKDMALMFVPSDEALKQYWEEGAGKILKNRYGSWENVPNNVIEKLINNNMLESFISYGLPSKFGTIPNDNNDPMGVSKDDIKGVWLGCNGAVMLTDRVYSPTDYVSVSYPTIVNENMKIIKWAIDDWEYKVYLNSLNSYYSFFIPTNNALLEYIDPCSYGKTTTQLFRFHYDNSKESVWASIWNYNVETKEVGDSIKEASYSQIRDRMDDILNTHIVVGNVEDGKTYYRTKGGMEIRVNNVALGENGMTVEGSYQMNEGQPIPVSFIYNQTPEVSGGNGKSYVLEGEPIMGTRKTVHDVLEEHTEFEEFYKLMVGSSLFETIHNRRNACGGTNISVFNTYHYTVYVPTNESIKALQQSGKLPTWEQVEQHELDGNLTAKTRDSLAIMNFLQYHIQDNALFIDSNDLGGDYETAVIDESTGRFYRVTVDVSDSSISIKDQLCKNDPTRTPAKVLKMAGLYNLVAREYQYGGTDAENASEIETTSSAVVHYIDKPLLINN